MGDYIGERFPVSSGVRPFLTTPDALNFFAKIDDFGQCLVFLSHVHCHQNTSHSLSAIWFNESVGPNVSVPGH